MLYYSLDIFNILFNLLLCRIIETVITGIVLLHHLLVLYTRPKTEPIMLCAVILSVSIRQLAME